MAKAKRYKRKYTIGTAFFLILLLVAIVGALPTVSDYYQIVWLILGIAGAIVAILNIQVREEVSFLIATTALLVIVIAFLAVPSVKYVMEPIIGTFLTNLAIGFGVAGFVVAIGLIAKLGLEK
jgi:hypothetical protein